jgi:hypothetical protein
VPHIAESTAAEVESMRPLPAIHRKIRVSPSEIVRSLLGIETVHRCHVNLGKILPCDNITSYLILIQKGPFIHQANSAMLEMGNGDLHKY